MVLCEQIDIERGKPYHEIATMIMASINNNPEN